jgi:hypothetical protein
MTVPTTTITITIATAITITMAIEIQIREDWVAIDWNISISSHPAI